MIQNKTVGGGRQQWVKPAYLFLAGHKRKSNLCFQKL